MSVTLFVGVLTGALLGAAIQNKGSSVHKYLLDVHPVLTVLLGLILLVTFIVIPSLALSGVIAIDTTPFFWGGCLVSSFIFGLFAVNAAPEQSLQKV